ncbi:hypothetical protein JKP88DRAFT_334503 [Tribonema minus]|uniref:Timeless N-terminal domain-containing protein n=1 Tax=Tribonema minus TaxID=303371 RepID=A0A836C9Z6_9STRA|nr:hypothetical protein JKP88DRAFT_334503 [Tribonema minus]
MDSALHKELLLVCTALGSTEAVIIEDADGREAVVEKFVRGENCLEWLQDLQRALRRDLDATRDVCILLSKLKVPQTKLLPLLIECRDDPELVKTVMKICVMLSIPLSRTAEMALEEPLHLTEKQQRQSELTAQERAQRRQHALAQLEVLRPVKRARQNALAQLEALRGVKRAFASRSVASVLVGALEGPLGRTGGRAGQRTEADAFLIELTLTLLRNVLAVRDDATGAITGQGDHQLLLSALASEFVLDILLVLAQGIGERDNAKLNLLLLDILDSIFRGQDAGHLARGLADKGCTDTVAAAAIASLEAASFQSDSQSAGSLGDDQRSGGGGVAPGGGQLKGTIRIAPGASGVARFANNPFQNLSEVVPQAPPKPGRRGAAAIVAQRPDAGAAGSAAAAAAAALGGCGSSARAEGDCARKALQAFARGFLEVGYDPFMRSIKAFARGFLEEEIRRDSSRLQAQDKPMFFRLAALFMRTHRLAWQCSGGKKEYRLGQILETLDVMCFNLALGECEHALANPKAPASLPKLTEALTLLTEMMQILAVITASPVKSHRVLALGLLTHVYLQRESADQLPALLRGWNPAKHSREHAARLAELVHVTLKYAARVAALVHVTLKHSGDHAARFAELVHLTLKVLEMWPLQREKGSSASDDLKEDPELHVALEVAQDFDVAAYVMVLTTNLTVRMYSTLLRHFAANEPRTNHHVLSFFMRMSAMRAQAAPRRRKGKRKSGGATAAQGQAQVRRRKGKRKSGDEMALEAAEGPTLEPMLYNVHTLMGFSLLLEDPQVRLAVRAHESAAQHGSNARTREAAGAAELRRLARYAATLTRNFAELCGRNHLAFVEELDGCYGAAAFQEAFSKSDKADDGMYESSEDEGAAVRQRYAAEDGSASPQHQRRRRRSDGAAAPASPADDTDEEEWGEETAVAAISKAEAKRARRGKKRVVEDEGSAAEGGATGASKKRKAARWTKEEDELLRTQYPLYAGSASVYTVLAQEDLLEERGRTAKQIQRRVAKLGLPSAAADSDSDADSVAASGPTAVTAAAAAEGSGDDSDSDSDHAAASAAAPRVTAQQPSSPTTSDAADTPLAGSPADLKGDNHGAHGSGGSGSAERERKRGRRLRRASAGVDSSDSDGGHAGGGNSSADEASAGGGGSSGGEGDGSSEAGRKMAAVPPPVARRRMVLDDDEESD